MKLAIGVALGGSLTWLLGAGLNNFVIAMNGGRMPVYATVASGDAHHIVAGSHTVLGWLADWISVPMISLWGLGMASPGDYLVWGAEWVTPALVVLAVMFRLFQHFDF